MSTLALGASSSASRGRATTALRYLDVPALGVAAVLFVAFDWPIGGLVAGGVAWLCQRGIQVLVARHAVALQRRGDRRRALGFVAGASLARVWLVALAVLVTGLTDRESGLAAAVLAAVLFTIYLGTQFVTRLVTGEWDA